MQDRLSSQPKQQALYETYLQNIMKAHTKALRPMHQSPIGAAPCTMS